MTKLWPSHREEVRFTGVWGDRVWQSGQSGKGISVGVCVWRKVFPEWVQVVAAGRWLTCVNILAGIMKNTPSKDDRTPGHQSWLVLVFFRCPTYDNTTQKWHYFHIMEKMLMENNLTFSWKPKYYIKPTHCSSSYFCFAPERHLWVTSVDLQTTRGRLQTRLWLIPEELSLCYRNTCREKPVKKPGLKATAHPIIITGIM